MFLFGVMDFQTFSTAVSCLRFSHKSNGYKEMQCSDFKEAQLKAYMVS